MESFEQLKEATACPLYEGNFYQLPVTRGNTAVSPLKVNYIELLVEKGESVQAQNYLGASITAGSLMALFSGGFLCQYFGVHILALTSCCCALTGGIIVLHSTKTQQKA